MNSERTQQTPKWNKGSNYLKKETYELKKTTQNIEDLKKDKKNLRKKNQTETLEVKSFFSQTKNTVEGHSSRLEWKEDKISELKDKIEIKGGKKPRRTLSQITQEQWKEYARTQWLHQKTKPENHGHWRRRRGANQRDA
jgi:hypothetical protein